MNNDLISRDYVSKKICDLYSDGEKANKKDRTINEVMDIIDNAPTVENEVTEKQAITKIINSGWLVNHDKELRDKWERPKGEWIKDSVGTIICSNCGCSLGNIVVKLMYPFSFYYCPECGTKMEGGADNDK